MVASGVRLSEALALKPGDVDRTNHTVRIARAWKRDYKGWRIGVPKTKRSVRTINAPKSVLDKLDYTKEWLFTNPGQGNRAMGSPVRPANLRRNVWWPAVARAKFDLRPRIHDLRHTYASWMLAAGVPIATVSRQLGHESIKTTVDVYGHLDRASHEAAADRMAAILAAPA
nr:site-specific integrase [Mycobacterium haemophilum]